MPITTLFLCLISFPCHPLLTNLNLTRIFLEFHARNKKESVANLKYITKQQSPQSHLYKPPLKPQARSITIPRNQTRLKLNKLLHGPTSSTAGGGTGASPHGPMHRPGHTSPDRGDGAGGAHHLGGGAAKKTEILPRARLNHGLQPNKRHTKLQVRLRASGQQSQPESIAVL